MQKIEFSISFTPWTIDTYSVFSLDHEIENILYNQNEDGLSDDYDSYDWTFNHKGYVQSLAENWLDIVTGEVLDDVIKSIKLDGESYSPREYNFSTDNCNIIFEVDIDKLCDYIEQNKDDYEKNKIQSESGFMWLGDIMQQMLHYYLHNESIKALPPEYYEDSQRELTQGYEFIDYELK